MSRSLEGVELAVEESLFRPCTELPGIANFGVGAPAYVLCEDPKHFVVLRLPITIEHHYPGVCTSQEKLFEIVENLVLCPPARTRR